MSGEQHKRAGFVLVTCSFEPEAPPAWVKIDSIVSITEIPSGSRIDLQNGLRLVAGERPVEILDRIAPKGGAPERRWLDPMSVEALAQFEGQPAPRGCVTPDTIRFLQSRGLIEPAGLVARRPQFQLTAEGLAQLRAATAPSGAPAQEIN
ncbi:hypothetical protein [Bradyrhizobium sp.]|uniref:hypothetical protein n=1 Tax=Bradyrhizobium sp. TaxID=376 RepID=UPI0025BDE7CD|nr:hypothetical protein [Bradyrhizobium sp.]MCA3256248.1 hypothetical protein [Alphaproteobacteria bacterium]MCA3570683.1 hypothetical protein [Bradyrhizobium sp.]